MRKTFKSVCVPGLELNISPSHQGIALTVTMDEELSESQGITIAPSDVPALALAILEAALANNEAISMELAEGLSGLRREVRRVEERDKATLELAELEAEALELFRASQCIRTDGMYASVPSFAALSDPSKTKWLAVARKAREMAKEIPNA